MRSVDRIRLNLEEALLLLILCVYIHIRQLSSFRAPTLWFIDLTVATCHIQYNFPSLCQFVHEKTDKTRKYSKAFSYDTKMAADGY